MLPCIQLGITPAYLCMHSRLRAYETRVYCMRERIGVYVCRSTLQWHKSMGLSSGAGAALPICPCLQGERYFTLMIGQTEGGERKKKVSHAQRVWDGQKIKCRVIKEQRAACASCKYVERLGGRDVSKPLVHIICISAGPVTHYLRSACVK